MDAEEVAARRRAALRAQLLTLPPAGTPAYWHRLETPLAAEALPLEVLVQCVRERWEADRRMEAQRVFTLILGRIQRQVGAWGAKVASQSAAAHRHQARADLVQECYLELWRALTIGDIAYWAESFGAALVSLQSHTAHACMERWAYWTRSRVTHPTRVPARALESLDVPHADETTVSLAERREDPNAARAFDLVEYAHVHRLVRALSPARRAVLYARYWEGQTQQEIATALGIGTRAVRWREQQALDQLREWLLREEDA